MVIAKGLHEDEVAKTCQFALRPENSNIREVFFLGLRVLGSERTLIKTQSSALEYRGQRISKSLSFKSVD